ncbi:MlaE family ABC transporter permease [Ralstonia mannitolilytica]
MITCRTPQIEVRVVDGRSVAFLSGDWTTLALAERAGVRGARQQIRAGLDNANAWCLTEVGRIDHFGAQLLWRAWGNRWPEHLDARPDQQRMIDRVAKLDPGGWKKRLAPRINPVAILGAGMLDFFSHARDGIAMVGQLVFDFGRLLRAPHRGPWREISANIYSTGYKALGITALVGFLIGIVLSYLSANQLRVFGASIFIVNILGMAIIRELGPVLAAILVAGRSGSAITAQIGVMRVTEELDAMRVMGISHGFRLILPKVIALAIAMPLLVAWTDLLALGGGILAARFQLDISPAYFITSLPDAVPVANLWLGIGKGVVFGMLIALVACHFGLRIEPNTQSLGEGTTTSVVVSITIVILADAVFAILFKDVGL